MKCHPYKMFEKCRPRCPPFFTTIGESAIIHFRRLFALLKTFPWLRQKRNGVPLLRSVFRNSAEADAPDGGDGFLVVDLGEDQGGLRVLAGRGCFVGCMLSYRLLLVGLCCCVNIRAAMSVHPVLGWVVRRRIVMWLDAMVLLVVI